MNMKKWVIGAIISVVFACGIFVYTQWDKARFSETFPQPPTVEQGVKADPPDSELLPPQNSLIDADSETGAEESKTSTPLSEQMSDADSPHVDTEDQAEDISQSVTEGQTDEEQKHSPPQKQPENEELPRIEDMDPDELADRIHASLIRRFGDIPEVHTYAVLKRKRLKNQPLTLDEHIDYRTAMLHLWPDPRTEESLKVLLEERAAQNSGKTQNGDEDE